MRGLEEPWICAAEAASIRGRSRGVNAGGRASCLGSKALLRKAAAKVEGLEHKTLIFQAQGFLCSKTEGLSAALTGVASPRVYFPRTIWDALWDNA